MAAVVNEQGQPRHVASALLGDRVHIESLAIQAGRIVVQMIGHGPGDGACCPTQEQTRAFQLAGDTLEGVPLTLEQLKNAEYLSEWPTGGKAKLTDGTFFEPYEPGAASGVRLTLSEHVAFGDLHVDEIPDAAVVLYVSGGGSGTFRYLAAVVNEGASRGTSPQPSSVIASRSSRWRSRTARSSCRWSGTGRTIRFAARPRK